MKKKRLARDYTIVQYFGKSNREFGEFDSSLS